MVRIKLASVEITDEAAKSKEYLFQILGEAFDAHHRITKSSVKLWLDQNNIKIICTEEYDASTLIKKIIYYVDVDEATAIEFYLKF